MPFSSSRDGFWTPVSLLNSDIGAHPREWNALQMNEIHNSSLDQTEFGGTSLVNFPVHELTSRAAHADMSAGRNTSGTALATLNGQGRECNCISVLANSLERINGDADNDVDSSDQFDHLLVQLHDGIETCKKVKLCKRCSVYTTNSMVVVTLVQQLAAVTQTLSLQLVGCEQQLSTTSSIAEIPQSLRADIRVGEYTIRASSLHLKFMFPVASIYFHDLQQLIEHLRDDMKKGTKTSKMLSAVADVVRKASRSLQR